uniref:Small ribosomal subunit protein uS2c n=1 Tax=Staurocarteria crucifera TaxID=47781 RepID=A0A0S2IC25_9CHLO|nr:ribosomal protein S2 [Carteria crucifera]
MTNSNNSKQPQLPFFEKDDKNFSTPQDEGPSGTRFKLNPRPIRTNSNDSENAQGGPIERGKTAPKTQTTKKPSNVQKQDNLKNKSVKTNEARTNMEAPSVKSTPQVLPTMDSQKDLIKDTATANRRRTALDPVSSVANLPGGQKTGIAPNDVQKSQKRLLGSQATTASRKAGIAAGLSGTKLNTESLAVTTESSKQTLTRLSLASPQPKGTGSPLSDPTLRSNQPSFSRRQAEKQELLDNLQQLLKKKKLEVTSIGTKGLNVGFLSSYPVFSKTRGELPLRGSKGSESGAAHQVLPTFHGKNATTLSFYPKSKKLVLVASNVSFQRSAALYSSSFLHRRRGVHGFWRILMLIRRISIWISHEAHMHQHLDKSPKINKNRTRAGLKQEGSKHTIVAPPSKVKNLDSVRLGGSLFYQVITPPFSGLAATIDRKSMGTASALSSTDGSKDLLIIKNNNWFGKLPQGTGTADPRGPVSMHMRSISISQPLGKRSMKTNKLQLRINLQKLIILKTSIVKLTEILYLAFLLVTVIKSSNLAESTNKKLRIRKSIEQMLKSGIHFGEKAVKCNARMRKYIWTRTFIDGNQPAAHQGLGYSQMLSGAKHKAAGGIKMSRPEGQKTRLQQIQQGRLLLTPVNQLTDKEKEGFSRREVSNLTSGPKDKGSLGIAQNKQGVTSNTSNQGDTNVSGASFTAFSQPSIAAASMGFMPRNPDPADKAGVKPEALRVGGMSSGQATDRTLAPGFASPSGLVRPHQILEQGTSQSQQEVSLHQIKPLIKKGRHVLNLFKTRNCLNNVLKQLTKYAAKGNKFLFVGTKKSAAGLIARAALFSKNAFFVNTRWLGGMLTNWKTILKSISQIRPILQEKQKLMTNILTKRQRIKNQLLSKLDKIRTKIRLVAKKGSALIKKLKIENVGQKRLETYKKVLQSRNLLSNKSKNLLKTRQTLIEKRKQLLIVKTTTQHSANVSLENYKILLQKHLNKRRQLRELQFLLVISQQVLKTLTGSGPVVGSLCSAPGATGGHADKGNNPLICISSSGIQTFVQEFEKEISRQTSTLSGGAPNGLSSSLSGKVPQDPAPGFPGADKAVGLAATGSGARFEASNKIIPTPPNAIKKLIISKFAQIEKNLNASVGGFGQLIPVGDPGADARFTTHLSGGLAAVLPGRKAGGKVPQDQTLSPTGQQSMKDQPPSGQRPKHKADTKKMSGALNFVLSIGSKSARMLAAFALFGKIANMSLLEIQATIQKLELKMSSLALSISELNNKLVLINKLNNNIFSELKLLKLALKKDIVLQKLLLQKMKRLALQQSFLVSIPKLRHLATPKTKLNDAVKLILDKCIDPIIKKMPTQGEDIYDDKLRTKSKKEAASLKKKWQRLEKYFGGVAKMKKNKSKLVAILIGQKQEKTAVLECQKVGIKTIQILDTNCNPSLADYFVPANDDSRNSIKYILTQFLTHIRLGQKLRKNFLKRQLFVRKTRFFPAGGRKS